MTKNKLNGKINQKGVDAMEEKILSVLLDMQIDIKKIQKDQEIMQQEIKEIKEDQKEMKQEIKGIKEEIRITKLNTSKILEVQNKTLEFLKDVIKKNEEEHRNFDNRINSIEIKQAI